MVSLEHRQDLATLVAQDSQLQRLESLLNGTTVPPSKSGELGVREQLLSAVVDNDASGFRRVADAIGGRRISPESDWCQDDYLVFLLLLGQEKFGERLLFVNTVIEARTTNVNPIPRKLNDVFGAISRQEFGIDGEFGFLKIPFLNLVGKLRIGPPEAKKVLKAMSKPGLLENMPPFLRLLAQKAHDLVLTERYPSEMENAAQLVERFESHAKEFSLSDWTKVLTALPGRVLIAIGTAIIGLGVFPVLFGIGKGIVDAGQNAPIRLRPAGLAINLVHVPGPELPPEAAVLVKSLQAPTIETDHHSLTLVIEAEAFSSATPAFVVEVSHHDHPIRSAFAFTKSASTGNGSFTIVPVARDGGRFRAMVPEQPIGATLCFVVEFDAPSSETEQSASRRLALRALE